MEGLRKIRIHVDRDSGCPDRESNKKISPIKICLVAAKLSLSVERYTESCVGSDVWRKPAHLGKVRHCRCGNVCWRKRENTPVRDFEGCVVDIPYKLWFIPLCKVYVEITYLSVSFTSEALRVRDNFEGASRLLAWCSCFVSVDGFPSQSLELEWLALQFGYVRPRSSHQSWAPRVWTQLKRNHRRYEIVAANSLDFLLENWP